MSILKDWKNVKRETKKLQALLDYRKDGLLTDDELERLVDEQQIKNSEDKGIQMAEQGEDEYAKTHSNCCDSRMLNGICLSCKEHTISQKDSDY